MPSETDLVKKIKSGWIFVIVFTHCQHTFMSKRHVKVDFALQLPFTYVYWHISQPLHRITCSDPDNGSNTEL